MGVREARVFLEDSLSLCYNGGTTLLDLITSTRPLLPTQVKPPHNRVVPFYCCTGEALVFASHCTALRIRKYSIRKTPMNEQTEYKYTVLIKPTAAPTFTPAPTFSPWPIVQPTSTHTPAPFSPTITPSFSPTSAVPEIASGPMSTPPTPTAKVIAAATPTLIRIVAQTPTSTSTPTNTPTPTATATFTPTPSPTPTLFALKTFHGRYVTAMNDQPGFNWELRAETGTLGDWEKFTLILLSP